MEVLSDIEGVIKYEYDKNGKFIRAHVDEDVTPGGTPVTAKLISPESIKLHSTSKAQFASEVEEVKSFMEVLTSWDGKWMWSGLRLTESIEWVAECLKNRTLVCVTDGSYQKEKAPN